MLECTALALVPLGLVLVGIGLLWTRIWLHQRGRLTADDVPARLLSASGWSLLVLGLFAVVAITTNVVAIITCPMVGILLAAAVRRHQNSERQALLRLLTTAAERGIPLETAAQAFADERDDMVGLCARDLADYLDAGVPLGLALRRSRNAVPTAVLLAADLGERTGTLGLALRQAVTEIDELEMTLRSLLEKFFYLAVVVLVALGTLTFLMINIIPVFVEMFDDFEVALVLPEVTRGLIAATRSAAGQWYVTFPIAGVLMLLLVVGLLYYVRFSPRDLPVARVLWRRVDCALVLRWLAIGVDQKRPISEVVRLLAGYFPRPGLRIRLQWAVKQMDAGAHWCDSLERAGLVRRPEGVVFRAAERTGNLVWALKEMADSSVRRTAYRIRALLSVVFPVAVLAVGACVFVIALAILAPLLSMIQHMT